MAGMNAAERTWGDDAAGIAYCPEHGLHGERDECFVCHRLVEQVQMVPVHTAAKAWRALERVRDRWISHALEMAHRVRDIREELLIAEFDLSVAQAERDEGVEFFREVLKECMDALGDIPPWVLEKPQIKSRNRAITRAHGILCPDEPALVEQTVAPPRVPHLRLVTA